MTTMTAIRTDFEIAPRGAFDLRRSAGFGFGPSTGARQPEVPVMRMAFCVDGLAAQAGVTLRQRADGIVTGEVLGTADVDGVRRQVARILSLDYDGTEWEAIGRRDPVLGALQARHPGFRPVLFHSPYEAAAWGVIQARRPQPQSAALRRRLCEAHGQVFELAGERVAAFPLPEQLLVVRSLPGLEPLRLQRLHAIAEAALAGRLEASRLLALGPEAAREEVRQLPGIGEFFSGLITVRATGFADAMAEETKSMRAVAHYYGLGDRPRPEQFAEVFEAWRPFRTWSLVLMRYASHREGV